MAITEEEYAECCRQLAVIHEDGRRRMKAVAKEHGFATAEEYEQHCMDEFEAGANAYEEYVRERCARTGEPRAVVDAERGLHYTESAEETEGCDCKGQSEPLPTCHRH